MISLLPKYLNRYKEVGWLLIKHGRGDLLRHSDLQAAVGDQLERSEETVARAEELASDLERLGPTFVKLGQFLSTRHDLLPKPYLEALARLQDAVEPIPLEEAKRIIATELGGRVTRTFAHFDEQPLASASLGQVHRARLHDGREVVVKVQRPGVRETIVDDLDALEDLASMIEQHTETGRRYEFGRLASLLRKMLLRELDYRHEAESLEKMRNDMRRFKRITVPEPIRELTTSLVLTMQYLPGTKITPQACAMLDEADRKELASELFQAYLHQILVCGFFHADPHPGNLSLLSDGRIAMLDLGMTVRIPSKVQQQMVKLLMAISDGRGEEAADAAIQMGTPYRDFRRANFCDRIERVVADSRDTSLEMMDMGRLVLEVQSAAASSRIQLPEEILLLSKTMLHLEESLCILDPEFDANAEIRDTIGEVVRRRAGSLMSWSRAYETLMEVNELLGSLPRRMNKILDLVADNELSVKVDAVDERKLIEGIQKVANRITAGLLLAALIVGASLMVNVQTPLSVFGYPVISLFFFLAAGGGALILALRILWIDRRR